MSHGKFKISLIAAAVSMAVVAGATVQAASLLDTFIPAAEAAQGDGAGKGAMGANRGGGAGKGQMGSGDIQRGGNKRIGEILEEDEDSDRPAWAGGQKELNPHRGEGSAGGDTQKGGDYGDLWVILRDDLGNPILDENDNVQPCVDLACSETIALTEDGELPAEYADDVIAVEFGRLNISRSPSSVLEHSLVEALSKLDGGVLGEDVTLDPSGRLTIDGSTIDSPLENLALYEALLTAPVDDEGNVTLSVTTSVEGGGNVTYSFTVPESVRLDLAASAIAAASDKTGELTVDEVVNISKFLEVDDDLAGLVGDYTYDSSVYDTVKVWILVETSPGVYETREVVVSDYVTFNPVPAIDGDTDGIDRFTQAADDSVQVLEFVHDNAIDQ
ncbi:hypothetical protein [Thiohalobacter thiocyanaticus]|uniref:Uncharacterized protein n=1 Tax=Thiohalobacter thiocyanaticus TaxID=585455 RepID=A0A426QIX3_9GAMM|nr:hypothetical protein [Thiohalobacter thiocyanaticus]RRQ21666.1 hypothetical protein D6C00_06700 [Thiohalobacter thiocyanaticus]